MKAVALLIVLCACLSSGQQWPGYRRPYQKIVINDWNSIPQKWGQQFSPYNVQKLNRGELAPIFLPDRRRPYWFNKFNTQVVGSGLGPNDNLNTYAKLIGKNYAGNEMLRNNGIQNNLSHYNRRFLDDVSVKRGADTKLVQVLSRSKPWDQVNPYQNECYGIVEIIKDLSLVTHTNSISEEKQNLKSLFSIIRAFILNNNLQNAPFSVVVYEIGKILLRETDNSKPLREQEIDLILQKFKEQELHNFLLEIRSRPDLSLQVVVSKLARLLHRLLQDLINKGLPREIVKLVINRAVQLSVPLVGYYFEKECKIKTQKYIVRNLEVALNVKLEGVQHVGSLDNLVNWGGLDNSGNSAQVWSSSSRENLAVLGGLGSVGGPWNEVYVNSVGGVVNEGNPSGIGNLGSLGGLGSVGGPWNNGYVNGVRGIVNQGNPSGIGNLGSLGGLGSVGGPWNKGYVNGVRGVENQGNPSGIGNLGSLGGLGSVGGPWNEGYVNGVAGVVNQGNPSRVGNLGSLEGAANQGSLSGQGNVENLNSLETKVGPGISLNMGNQGNLGDQAGPIDTGNTQGIDGFENAISPKVQGAVE